MDVLAGEGQARRDAPDTSKVAARVERGTLRRAVLETFAGAEPDGLVTQEVIDRFPGRNPQSIQPRCTELLRAGHLEYRGEQRQTRYGSAARVLHISDAGRAVLAEAGV